MSLRSIRGYANMSTPTNWPNPERPGTPLFPERNGWHWIDAGTGHVRPLNWCCLSQGWYSSPQTWAGRWKCTDKWTYHGPCLTPEQISEMLAAERERCAKVCEDTYEKSGRDFEYLGCNDAASQIRNLGAAP